MKIKMIALAPFDGWAFIIRDERLYLLRPPYHTNDLIESSEKEMATAISRYHFRKCNASFKTLLEAVYFLKETYAEEMKKMGFSLPDPEELKTLLEFANDEVLDDYLDKIEKEFIPNRLLDAAESLALELLRLEKVKQDAAFFNRTVDIVSKCREERNLLLQLTEKPVKLSGKYPNAEKKYTKKAILEKMTSTRDSGQLIPIGA
ncbi:MAG: hypothetical protein GY940_09190 [bacterium]|nr:hypothetical protein [bacterium]